MKCSELQRRLLELEKPDHPPPEVRGHLTECASCRRLQRRLLQIEQRVPLIAVPRSNAKAALLHRILAEPAASAQEPARRETLTSNTSSPTIRGTASAKETARRETPKFRPFAAGKEPGAWRRYRIAGVTTLAASLAFFAFVWANLQHANTPSTPPFSANLTARLVQHDLELAAAANNPREKVKVLADLAADLHRETDALARTATADDLTALANLYAKVGQGLFLQAQKLSPGERSQVLDPIILQLQGTAHDAQALARTVPAAATPLRTIASTATEVEGQLRQLTGA